MTNDQAEISIKNITYELQNLEKNQKTTENIIESYSNWSETRKNVLDKLIEYVIENPNKQCKKLMEFVWKKICYSQISKLRPLLDFNSTTTLSTTSSRREQYEWIFSQMIDEFVNFYNKLEKRIVLKLDININHFNVHLRETQVICNICSGDLYRYVYNFKGTIADFNNATMHYYRAFLVDPNNESSHNQLGILYKNDGNYFMSMFYFIKGCLTAEETTTLISKNKDITYNYVKNQYNSLPQMDSKQDMDVINFKYGVILLVCDWLNLTTNSVSPNLIDDIKKIHKRIVECSLNKIPYLTIDDLNSTVKNDSIQKDMLFVCVLFIFALEKLRKTDSSRFREALDLFIDIIYMSVKYTINVIDRIFMLKCQKQKKYMESFISNDDDDDEDGLQYKYGYLSGRCTVKNHSNLNNGHLIESESELSENDNHINDIGSTHLDYCHWDTPQPKDIDEILIQYALDHCHLNVIKIIIDWVTKSIHVIPVINEVTNDNILKYLKKSIERIRDVMYYFGFNDESLNTELLKEILPEDILVLDHHLFVDSKFVSWTNFDLFKPSHEYTLRRVYILCYLIDSHRLFKKGGFEELMKSFEYVPTSDVITISNVVGSRNRRNNNKTTKSRRDTNKNEKSNTTKTTNLTSKKLRVNKTNNEDVSTTTIDIISINTPYLCIVEYGTFRNSLYLVKKMLNSQLMTILISKSCLKKIDYHKKNCPKVRESAKFIETTIASGNNLLILQNDTHFIPIDNNDLPPNNKFFIPLIECALYYRKHTLSSIDINIVISYHDYKKIKQNNALSSYLHRMLLVQNINYINIEAITKKK